MRKIDIVGIAFGNFKRRKTRSILTVLGVVIGTAAIVTMMSVGIAVNVTFNEQFGSMGDLTTVTVSPGYDMSTGQQNADLTDESVAKFQALDHVTLVSPELRLSGKMVSGKYTCYANIKGIKTEYMQQLGMVAEQGRLLSSEDTLSGKNIPCLFGSDVAYDFYKPSNSGGGMIMMGGGWSEDGTRQPPDVDPMDAETKIRFTFDYSYGEHNPGEVTVGQKPKLYNMKPTGVLKSDNGDSSYTVYIDMETARKLKKEQEKFQNSQNAAMNGGVAVKRKTSDSYDQIKVVADSIENTAALAEQIKGMGYQAYANGEWISNIQKQAAMLQMVLAGIGGVSLLVAAIGIANTMIMSIYERTREIGIMKVIGCYLKDIRTMFLTEAAFIGLFGGIIGVGLSYGLSFLMNFLASKGDSSMGGMLMGLGGGGTLSVIPPWLAVIAVLFAILVALVSGLLPARRAMRLSALEAMRN